MSNLNSNLETLFDKMEGFISTKTIVGEPLTIGDTIIVPLIDVSFGVGAGSTDSNEDKKTKEIGAGGIGAKITPSAVLVIQNGTTQLVSVKNNTGIDKIIDMVPGFISKLNIDSLFKKKKEDDELADDNK